MLTILVILFFFLFLFQQLSLKKENESAKTLPLLKERAGNLQFLHEHVKVLKENQRGILHQDNEIIASTTRAYRDLHRKFETGLIDEPEFNYEVSKILFSIDMENIRKSA